MSPLPSHSLVPVGAVDIVDAYLVRACATAPAIEHDVQVQCRYLEGTRGARKAFLWAAVESERIVSARYSFIGIR